MRMRLRAPMRALAWRKGNAYRGMILLYHRVTEALVDPWNICVSPRHFEEQIAILRKTVPLLPLSDLVAQLRQGTLPPRATAITFDDGYTDNLLHAKPILEAYNAPATIFIASRPDPTPREFWWDELERIFLHPGKLPSELSLTLGGKDHHWWLGDASFYTPQQAESARHWTLGRPPVNARQAICAALYPLLFEQEPRARKDTMNQLLAWSGQAAVQRASHRMMTPAEWRELDRSPLIELGAHTCTHPPLSRLTAKQQDREIRASKVDLESALGHPVKSFAYPFGNYARASVDLVAEAGFDYACAVADRPLRPSSPRYELPRVCVGNWSGAKFAAKLKNGLQL